MAQKRFVEQSEIRDVLAVQVLDDPSANPRPRAYESSDLLRTQTTPICGLFRGFYAFSHDLTPKYVPVLMIVQPIDFG